MFLFFRRIRHALLAGGAFRRYLVYALGEILLFVQHRSQVVALLNAVRPAVDLRLGKRAFELIEEDYRNMLLPLDRFEPLVPAGDYVLTADSRALGRYYGDVLFYRTALSQTNQFLQNQRRVGEDLARLIRETYDLP